MRLLILIFSIGAVFFSCSLSSDADEESFNISIAISSPNNQAIVSDSVFIDIEIDDASMISKVELWVNNDSTGIQDLAPPFSIIWNTKDYKDIPIEERNPEELSHIEGFDKNGNIQKVQIYPKKSKAMNLAFDVTPAKYVTGLITEKGVCEASKEGLKNLFK